MRKTGIRNLKDHLSEYLQYVRNGETVVITHRNREIAKVIPAEPNNERDQLLQSLQRLAEQKLIILPENWDKNQNITIHSKDLPKVRGKQVSEIILNDRR